MVVELVAGVSPIVSDAADARACSGDGHVVAIYSSPWMHEE